MAHYKWGVALKKDELISEDKFFGLTQKYFRSDYLTVKNGIMQELESFACQIGDYLQLNDAMTRANRYKLSSKKLQFLLRFYYD